MPETTLEERLDAVERALTGETASLDRDGPATDHDESGHGSDDFERLEARVEAVEDAVDELQAALQAVRGYVGSIKHVNDEVADRADVALAKAEAVERILETKPDGAHETKFEPGVSTEQRPGVPDDETPDQVNDSNRHEDRSTGHQPAEEAVGHQPAEGAVGHQPAEDSWLTGAQSATSDPETGDRAVGGDDEAGSEGRNDRTDDGPDPAGSLLDRLRRGL